jgi:ribosomal protein L13E
MKDAVKRGIVKTVNNGIKVIRNGRGYSKSELVQSGVTDIRVARKRKIPIDPFRKTTHQENIEQLKVILGGESPKTESNAKRNRARKRTKQSP